MIFIDTSVWVAYFRGRDRSVRPELDRLLDDDRVALAAPVRIELLGGVRKDHQQRLGRLLGALPTCRATDSTWDRMEKWSLDAGRKGYHFGVGDLLVAAIAADHGGEVWSLDSDFTNLTKLGFIKAYRPS